MTGRRRAVFELAAAVASLAGRVLLRGTPLETAFLVVAALGWLAYFAARLWRTPGLLRAWGLAGPWREGLLWHGGATLLGLAAIALVAVATGRGWTALHPLSVVVYLAWAAAQEFAVQNVFVAGLLALGAPRAVLPPLVGVVFGLAHMPVLPLAAIAVLGGTLWTALWLKAPNLWTLAASHALLGGAAIVLLLGADPAADLLQGFAKG